MKPIQCNTLEIFKESFNFASLFCHSKSLMKESKLTPKVYFNFKENLLSRVYLLDHSKSFLFLFLQFYGKCRPTRMCLYVLVMMPISMPFTTDYRRDQFILLSVTESNQTNWLSRWAISISRINTNDPARNLRVKCMKFLVDVFNQSIIQFTKIKSEIENLLGLEKEGFSSC